jgi:hypothetical protein
VTPTTLFRCIRCNCGPLPLRHWLTPPFIGPRCPGCGAAPAAVLEAEESREPRAESREPRAESREPERVLTVWGEVVVGGEG